MFELHLARQSERYSGERDSFLFKGDGSHSARTKKFRIQFPGMEGLEQRDRQAAAVTDEI
jgi:hypothetical protein